jgi:subtilisin-like proprotein convertase family protein
VTANVSFSFHRRGDVKITLISPSGTPSEMISYRDNDASEKGIYSSRSNQDSISIF